MSISIHRLTYPTRLTLIVGVSIVVLVGLIGVFASRHLVHNIERAVVTETEQLLTQLADQAIVGTLVNDPIAQRVQLEKAMAFPSVTYATITDHLLRVLSETERTDQIPNWHDYAGGNAAGLIGETRDAWYFLTPIIAITQKSPLDIEKTSEQTIGYFALVRSKTDAHALTAQIVYPVVGFSLCVLLFSLLWLRRSIGRLTIPLVSLSNQLSKAVGQGTDFTSVRTSADGPEEIQTMSTVFNSLMARIEEQQAALESEVSVRTADARTARDVALSSEKYKSEFVATISHEMRAPLQAIIQYVQHTMSRLEFVDDLQLAQEARGHQRIVLQEANNLLEKINQILDLAQAERSGLEVSMATVNLNALTTGIERTVRPLAEVNGNQLRIDVIGTTIIHTDTDKFSQIVTNLLTNAAKFTLNGTITCSVSGTDDHITVVVQDTGIGIADNELSRIWEPFKQVDMSFTRPYPGTGLGLAITRHFVTALHGSVEVHSTMGEGTRFVVVLPNRPIPHRTADKSCENTTAAVH